MIQYGDGTVLTGCVEFAEPEITGLDVLQRSGLDVVYHTTGMGVKICKLGREGCDDPNRCFCQCKGASCVYWSYWHLKDGVWQYSNLGASSHTVQPGAVEGWTWGPGSVNSAIQPPQIRFEDICRAATSQPTLTDTPQPTATSAPADTPLPTDTPRPTATPPPTEAAARPAPSSTFTSVPSPATAVNTATPLPTSTPTLVPLTVSQATEAPPATRQPPSHPTTTPTGTPTGVPPSPTRASPGSYFAFGGIVAVLAVVGLVVWQRGKG